jgi:ribosome-binding protein aMBF1 (putative translation factor)
VTRQEPISTLIRRTRRAYGWSQHDLATRLSNTGGMALTRHEVSRWELGVRIPGRWWRRHIGRVFGLPEPVLAAAAAAERTMREAAAGAPDHRR